MLQISAASLVELVLLQVVRANILYLLCLFVSACLHAPTASTWLGEGRGARLWQITMGAAEIKHFYFCCNWEKGPTSASHMGLLLQILISILPLYSSRCPFKYLVEIPDYQSLHYIQYEYRPPERVCIFAMARLSINISQLSTLASGGISCPGPGLATHWFSPPEGSEQESPPHHQLPHLFIFSPIFPQSDA